SAILRLKQACDSLLNDVQVNSHNIQEILDLLTAQMDILDDLAEVSIIRELDALTQLGGTFIQTEEDILRLFNTFNIIDEMYFIAHSHGFDGGYYDNIGDVNALFNAKTVSIFYIPGHLRDSFFDRFSSSSIAKSMLEKSHEPVYSPNTTILNPLTPSPFSVTVDDYGTWHGARFAIIPEQSPMTLLEVYFLINLNLIEGDIMHRQAGVEITLSIDDSELCSIRGDGIVLSCENAHKDIVVDKGESLIIDVKVQEPINVTSIDVFGIQGFGEIIM
ncbi:hypothetical protein ADUPG1_013762, partial [Aduncisulcus paluster]